MVCSICGKSKCKMTRGSNRPYSKILSMRAVRLALCEQARSVFDECTLCERFRIAYLLTKTEPLFIEKPQKNPKRKSKK